MKVESKSVWYLAHSERAARANPWVWRRCGVWAELTLVPHATDAGHRLSVKAKSVWHLNEDGREEQLNGNYSSNVT